MKKLTILLFLGLFFLKFSCRDEQINTNTVNSESTESTEITIAAPGSLIVYSLSTDSIELRWVDNSDNEDFFILERDTLPDFSNPAEIKISANQIIYTDVPAAGNIYFYRIKAMNGDFSSSYSNTTYQVFKLDIRITFDFGVNVSSSSNIYTIWAENTAFSYHQPMRLGDKLLGLHEKTIISGVGTAYWQFKYHMFDADDVDLNTDLGCEIDAVSSATPSQVNDPDDIAGPLGTGDFITEATLKSSTPAQFTVYFEYNHSWDYNDWFPSGINTSGQPAVLYAVDVDLTRKNNTYQLVFTGWTPRYDITPLLSTTYDLPILSAGELCRETRFITHKKDAGPPVAFGAEIADNTNATASVGVNGIKLEILR